jgi:hypothetical protein
MGTSKVDTKKRIVLPNSRPGDVYDVQEESLGRYRLVRLEKPDAPKKMSKSECLRAMDANPLQPTMTWDELRRLTREP